MGTSMTQKEKELLLQDLCGRLPYGVKCLVNYTFCNETTDYEDVKSSTVDTLITINQQTENYFFDCLCEWFDVDEFKPYLFPMSSMTEEQKGEYYHIVNYISSDDTKTWMEGEFIYVDTTQFLRLINFYHRNHLDYRGLINGGLAIDATGLNIY